MYMPDPVVAVQRLDVPPVGSLLRFYLYDMQDGTSSQLCTQDGFEDLKSLGLHRNVFLVDSRDHVLWRVGDYEQPYAPDSFVDVSRAPEMGKARGVTFHGHIFEINLADGSLRKVGWTK